MQVILLERIERLGQMGDIVAVKAGYARNYLLPQKKALRATKANQEQFEAQRTQFETQNLTRRTEAEALAERLDGLAVVLIRQAGENGQLYGSVTARDISDAVTEAGFTLDRRQVVIERPIKELGVHAIRVTLHPEVQVTVKTNVAQSQESAVLQAAAAEPDEPATSPVAEPEPAEDAEAAEAKETPISEAEAGPASNQEAAAEPDADQPQTG